MPSMTSQKAKYTNHLKLNSKSKAKVNDLVERCVLVVYDCSLNADILRIKTCLLVTKLIEESCITDLFLIYSQGF